VNVQIDAKSVWSDIQAIKKSSPLIHNITNYVVMESTANGLLAIGAAPVMAHAVDEVEDMIAIAHSLVLNIGTLSSSWVQAMVLSLKAANSKGIPVVLDPVGVGATHYRTKTVHSFLAQGEVTAIRGNASEIASLMDGHFSTKGVDSLLSSMDCRDQARALASMNQCVVWMSGATDVITDDKRCILVHNGHSLMSKVTGMGCMATALTGAFLAINQDALLGCAHAAISMGVAGEIAAINCKGPGSFKLEFMDALYHLSLDQIEERIRVDIV
jgi:hydroxyethylthiazole kinase